MEKVKLLAVLLEVFIRRNTTRFVPSARNVAAKTQCRPHLPRYERCRCAVGCPPASHARLWLSASHLTHPRRCEMHKQVISGNVRSKQCEVLISQ